MLTRSWAGIPRPLDDDRMSDWSGDCLRRDYRLAIVRPAPDDRSVARVRDDDHFAWRADVGGLRKNVCLVSYSPIGPQER
jgi:hypothetical protein